VSDGCAYTPLCNAQAAFRISSRGTNFGAWVAYRTGRHRAYLGAASAAVSRLART